MDEEAEVIDLTTSDDDKFLFYVHVRVFIRLCYCNVSDVLENMSKTDFYFVSFIRRRRRVSAGSRTRSKPVTCSTKPDTDIYAKVCIVYFAH